MTEEGLPPAIEEAMLKAAADRNIEVTVQDIRHIFRHGLLAWPKKWITPMPTPNEDGSVYSWDAIVLPVPYVPADNK